LTTDGGAAATILESFRGMEARNSSETLQSNHISRTRD